MGNPTGRRILQDQKANGGPQIGPHIPLAGSLRLTHEAALANRSDLCLRAFVAKVDSVVTRVSYYHPVALVFHLPEELNIHYFPDLFLFFIYIICCSGLSGNYMNQIYLQHV